MLGRGGLVGCCLPRLSFERLRVSLNYCSYAFSQNCCLCVLTEKCSSSCLVLRAGEEGAEGGGVVRRVHARAI